MTVGFASLTVNAATSTVNAAASTVRVACLTVNVARLTVDRCVDRLETANPPEIDDSLAESRAATAFEPMDACAATHELGGELVSLT